MIKIALKRSYIGVPDRQQNILRALGLKKIGSSVIRTEDKAIMGMVNKVSHLVSVIKVDE